MKNLLVSKKNAFMKVKEDERIEQSFLDGNSDFVDKWPGSVN